MTTLAKKKRAALLQSMKVFKAIPRTGMGLLNTWVSNNKLTLIEQFDRTLLCVALKKNPGRTETGNPVEYASSSNQFPTKPM